MISTPSTSSTRGTSIQITTLSKSYPSASRPILDSIDLAVDAGEFLTLLGPSGCGKTTLLRMIAGLEKPDNGSLSFDQTPVFRHSPPLWIPPEDRDIGMVFQQYAVWPHLSVLENIEFPLTVGKRKSRFTREQARDKALAALQMVQLSGKDKLKPQQLSGGQQQRVALARALVMQPRLLLLDEPLSNLDTELRADLRREIRSLHDKLQMTVIHVTHDPVEAEELATRILRLKDGKIESDQKKSRPSP